MRSVADIGGATGWGEVRPPSPDDDILFHEYWEGRALALTLLTMSRVSGQNLDAFRYAQGRLDPRSYFDDGYYGRWLNATELMLVDQRTVPRREAAARVLGALHLHRALRSGRREVRPHRRDLRRLPRGRGERSVTTAPNPDDHLDRYGNRISPALRTEALEQLLTERGLVDPTVLDGFATAHRTAAPDAMVGVAHVTR